MADQEHTGHHQSRKLTRAEVEALADAMIGHAISVLTDDQPQWRRRLLLASACLRMLGRDHPDGIEVEVYVAGRQQ